MIFVQFFCDLCNPACQVRDATHEIKHGYAADAVVGKQGQMPEDWLILDRVPRTGVAGIACGYCVERGKHLAEAGAQAVERSAGPAAADEWPAKASPFSHD